MLLLVIGLVAVIVAVLVAVFLASRRRADDDGPAGRQNVRDRLRGRGRDAQWSTDPRVARTQAGRSPALSRRPAGEPRGYGGPGRGHDPEGFDQSRGYEPSPRGYGDSPARSRDAQRTERMEPARGGGRYQDEPEAATMVSARAPRTAPAARRGGVATDTGPAAALYDTGPSAADFTATRVNADPDLADSDVFPRVRADIPETEAKPKNQTKGRGRPSRGRHDDDDDDWPSTEWDKLSDEQYWAELSADNPLATTARSAQSSAPAPAAKPAPKPARPAAPSPVSGRTAPRPQPAQDASPEVVPARRRPPSDRPDRPDRAGSRQGAPRRPDGAETDPGRPGLAARPGDAAVQATDRLPVRNRRQPAADSGPPTPAPFPTGGSDTAERGLGRPASPGRASGVPPARSQGHRSDAARPRTDDDPLTSPAFARGAGAGADSRSYRTPGRSPSPPPAQSPSGYPGAADAYAADYPTPPGGYPADPRDSYPGAARDGYGHQARDGYAAPAGGYESRPGPSGGSRDYPASSGRHGYSPGQGDRSDLGAPRTDPGTPRTGAAGPRTSPGRRRSTAARQAPAHQAPSGQAPSGEAPSATAGLGNPYGSYVDTTPPAPAPSPGPVRPAAVPPASAYQPGQQPPDAGSYPGYGTGPAYSDPYRQGSGAYPANGPTSAGGPQPAAGARAGQRTTWYSAPPAAPPQSPPGGYPYQADPGYPAPPDYGPQPVQPGYTGPPPGSQDDTRYRSGQTDDPYGPDGYSGYHSRQG